MKRNRDMFPDGIYTGEQLQIAYENGVFVGKSKNYLKSNKIEFNRNKVRGLMIRFRLWFKWQLGYCPHTQLFKWNRRNKKCQFEDDKK